MVCLEIAVNGKRCVVAGGDQIPRVGASVTHRPERTTEQKTLLLVNGLSDDLATSYRWGDRIPLTVGDVVSIRVVATDRPDAPIPFPTGADYWSDEYDRDVHRAFTAALWVVTWHRLSKTHPERAQSNSTLKSLLFWAALAVVGILLWYFGR